MKYFFPTGGSLLKSSGLLENYLPDDRAKRWFAQISLILLGTILITISAKIKIPFYPVPMTMQSFVVIIIGFIYGPILGVTTVVFYLMQGAIGLPVFAGTPERGIGLLYMTGPTGGYLIGFVVAAILAGYLQQTLRKITTISSFTVMFLGHVAIYTAGLLYLGTFVGFDSKLIAVGLLPFLSGDLAKIVLACVVLPSLARLSGKSD